MIIRYIIQYSWQVDSGVHIHWKGAAEIVLGACTQYLDSNGHLQSIEQEKVRNSSFKSDEILRNSVNLTLEIKFSFA